MTRPMVPNPENDGCVETAHAPRFAAAHALLNGFSVPLSATEGERSGERVDQRTACQQKLSPQSPMRLVSGLVGFLVVASPLALIAWHELSEVLNGKIHAGAVLHGVGALLALAGTALVLARFMERTR
jgi:hypothetical protein